MKILAKVSYFGKNYCGWQIQPNGVSVEETIEKALSKILNVETKIFGSGRTDAGVHAKGQTFHFEVHKDVDLSKLRYSLNSILPEDINIISLSEVNQDFHARFSAKGKHYQYVINTSKDKDPFTYETAFHYPFPFDYDLLMDALLKFVGTHNFQNFTSKEEDEKNFVRNIDKITCKKNNNLIYVDLYGDGFMRYMIRYIIGTSLAVASSKCNIKYIDENLDSDTRLITSFKANSEGLYLLDVIY